MRFVPLRRRRARDRRPRPLPGGARAHRRHYWGWSLYGVRYPGLPLPRGQLLGDTCRFSMLNLSSLSVSIRARSVRGFRYFSQREPSRRTADGTARGWRRDFWARHPERGPVAPCRRACQRGGTAWGVAVRCLGCGHVEQRLHGRRI